MKTKIVSCSIIALSIINTSCMTITKDNQYYYTAIEEARLGNFDFAFMNLNNYIWEYPDSIHTKDVKFAIAEYYFQTNNFRDAIYKLSEFIHDYHEEDTAIFAQALLYNAILKYKTEPKLTEKIKEAFFSKSIFLIFSELKVKQYKSILNNSYKIVDYIDRIEVFKNNELFLKITP